MPCRKDPVLVLSPLNSGQTSRTLLVCCLIFHAGSLCLTRRIIELCNIGGRPSRPRPGNNTVIQLLCGTDRAFSPSLTITSTVKSDSPSPLLPHGFTTVSSTSHNILSVTGSLDGVQTRTQSSPDPPATPADSQSTFSLPTTVLPIHSNQSGHPLGTGAIVAIAVAASVLGTITSTLLFLWLLRKCCSRKRRTRGASLGCTCAVRLRMSFKC